MHAIHTLLKRKYDETTLLWGSYLFEVPCSQYTKLPKSDMKWSGLEGTVLLSDDNDVYSSSQVGSIYIIVQLLARG